MANKTTAKAAWDALKTQHIGMDRVRKARAQSLRQEFGDLVFKEGESIDDFAYRITKITDQLAVLGDVMEEETIVRKFLQVVPDRFGQITASIETLLDLEAVSLEELVGRLKAVEESLDRRRGRGGASGNGGAGKEIDGKLYFTEEQMVARFASRLNLNNDGPGAHGRAQSGSGARRGGGGRGRGRGRGQPRSGPSKGGNSGNGDDDACHYCGKSGHWKRECRKKKRDEEKAAASQPQANLAQAEEESPSLYMAVVTPAEDNVRRMHHVEHELRVRSGIVNVFVGTT
ncbi:unnamed protein product [Miscanthus lutarioriparius]|uniref:CCHC-type domain-containing protein n=1 Tax=Miscanthus lutarioriparius TaxID=422564 RepID=A0A811Q3B3_9POAL|nr:unnamed protein product [Miscanthus lutarioriparius]